MRRLRDRLFRRVAGVLAVVGAFAIALPAEYAFAQADKEDNEIHVLPVQGNVYMLVGGGGNVTVLVGNEGVLLVDTGTASAAARILDAVRKLSNKPIRYVLNTHVHGDHTGGNELFSKIGKALEAGDGGGNSLGNALAGRATVIAHENVLTRMSAAPAAGQSPVPFAALPLDTYLGHEKDIYFNGEPIQIFHEPAAHTDGDSIVFFRHSDVISAGDVFVTTSFPVIDLQRGGTIQGIIDGLNHIIELTIPADKQEGGTYVIPGHGRLCDEADVVDYRDMVTIVYERIRNLVGKGMTLEQVKAARLTRDYDYRYGGGKGPWTTNMFIEAIYKNLTAKK